MADNNRLPLVAFSILLALTVRERHGYGIIKQVEEDSNGKIKLGPGALYTSIKQLLARGLIIEVEHTDDVRRRYYRLSDVGYKILSEELSYYENAILLAKQRQVLNRAATYA